MVALIGGVGQMFGALIVVDDPQYGASSIVRDTATGLEWLGLFKTAGLSYNTVFSNLGPGGTFAGFRYANLDEVGTLFADAGIPDIDQTTSANSMPVGDLLRKIGTLDHGPFSSTSLALNDQSLTPGTHNSSELATDFSPDPSFPSVGTAIRTTTVPQADDRASSAAGSFLIRETPSVPEPGTLPLLVIGVFGTFVYGSSRGWRPNMRF
jgi:hypothetical protein